MPITGRSAIRLRAKLATGVTYQVVVRLAVLATLQILALADCRISKRIYALGRHTNLDEALYAFLDRHGIGLEAAR